MDRNHFDFDRDRASRPINRDIQAEGLGAYFVGCAVRADGPDGGNPAMVDLTNLDGLPLKGGDVTALCDASERASSILSRLSDIGARLHLLLVTMPSNFIDTELVPATGTEGPYVDLAVRPSAEFQILISALETLDRFAHGASPSTLP